MTDVILRMHDIHKSFGGVAALRGVSLEVRAGEVHALVGENGAGKSTLMKVLSGAARPDRGVMTLDGRPYAPRGPRDALARGIAMIYQELNLAADLSLRENLFLGREPSRFGLVDRARERAKLADVLSILDHPDLTPDVRVGELAPGAQQLAELGRALLHDARIVVLDEPTSSLSAKETAVLDEVIERLRTRGVSIVYISHFLEEVRRIADRYTVLRDGATVSSGDAKTTALDTIVEQMVGRRVEEAYPRVPHEPGEVVLELDALAGRRLPKSASLALRRGEIFGIAGLVGAGRTELLRAIYGLAKVKSGRVIVRGVPDRGRPVHARIAQRLGMLSEDRKGEGLARGLGVAENLTMSNAAPFSRFGLLAMSKRAAIVRAWLSSLAIKARDPEQLAGELSGGNQQKIALARLLHQDADVLLLDEPTRGVDVGSKAEIYRRIGELAASGKAVLVVSSYLPELLGVCDRIAVMHRGMLGAARARREWTEVSLLAEATRGAAA